MMSLAIKGVSLSSIKLRQFVIITRLISLMLDFLANALLNSLNFEHLLNTIVSECLWGLSVTVTGNALGVMVY